MKEKAKSNEEILKKAIEKAVIGGFNEGEAKHLIRNIADISVYALIFSHDFAKAFWGEEKVDFGNGMTEEEYHQAILNLPEDRRGGIRRWAAEGTQIKWQYHLQQMVISEDPILYLSKFL